MRLYLVRHGEAVHEFEDPLRPLSDRGIAAVKKVAEFLKQSDAHPQAFYHSTKKRAQQTAEIMQSVINPSAPLQEKECLCPNDPTDELFYDVVSFQEDTMVVGHLPYLSILTARLVPNDEPSPLVVFKPSSVAVLERDENKNWTIVSTINPAALQ